MPNLLKNRNAVYYFYLIVMAVIFTIWTMGNFINKRLLQLPVREIQQVPVKQVITDTKSFYPIWAKTAAAVKADAEAAGDLDDFFKKKEEAKTAEVKQVAQEPNYAALVSQNASLQSVADNGAVINGRFYEVGAGLDSLAVMRNGGQRMVPVLVGVRAESVTINVGKDRVNLTLRRGF